MTERQRLLQSGRQQAKILSRTKLQFVYSFFAVAVFFVFCVPSLHSQEETVMSGTVTSIEVIGIKRTKPHIARYPLEQFIGREASTLDLNEIEAVVRTTGILEPTAIELIETEDGLMLRLTVEEKWSIFPVPMVMAGTGGNSFGLFILDSNAFGQRDQAVLGGMYGSSGWMVMAMYNHTPNRRGLPGWNSFFMYNRREREDADKDKIIHRRYTQDQLRVFYSLYYPLTNYITIFTGFSFTNISLKENAHAFNQPEQGAMILGFTPGISLRHNNWDGFLLSQRSLSLNYTYNHALSGSSFHQAEFRGVYEQSLIPGFRLTARSGAIWKSYADILFEEGPQKAQVDILPRNFSARHYAGVSAGLEKHLFKTRTGTLSILGSWQCVVSHGSISGIEFDHGPSGGVRYYLSRLALPALGMNIAYNMNSGLYQVNFSMGMEF